jgi:RNA polymerase sigma-70 factor (ECF subfamily)
VDNPPAVDDLAQALWRRAAAGDTAAFERIVIAHQGRVRQQLRRLCQGDDALADDLAQDTFVQAWQALPGFAGQAQLGTWLYRIAFRAYLMHLRQRGRRLDEMAMGDELPELPDATTAQGPALRLDLAQALARLPEAQRVAIIHCEAMALSHDEAAAVLGWPLGTVKSHVARGKARLRLLLADWQDEVHR